MLVDSHCHLDAPEFDHDRDTVIQRARQAGVWQQVIPAITADGWPRLREICATQAGLFPAYGLHPMFLSAHQPEHLQMLGEWIAREKPLAVGECGLDFVVEDLDASVQQHYFDGQLALAREFDLPVIVHARRAVDAAIASFRRIGKLRGVVHSFSGSPEQAHQLWQLGFLIGIGALSCLGLCLRSRLRRGCLAGCTAAAGSKQYGHRNCRCTYNYFFVFSHVFLLV